MNNEFKSIDLDDLDTSNLEDDSEDESTEFEPSAEPARADDSLSAFLPEPEDEAPEEEPLTTGAYDIPVVKSLSGLRLRQQGRRSKPLRFPFAKMDVGDGFEINPDPKSRMRRDLLSDVRKMKKLPEFQKMAFRIREDAGQRVYCVRTK